jgi:protein TonB
MLVPDGAVIGHAANAAPATFKRSGSSMFLDAMLEMPSTAHDSRKPLKMLASMAIHTAIIAALLILPVYFASNVISVEKLQPTFVFTPPPVRLPPPPPAAAASSARAIQTMPRVMPVPIVAPRVIPKQSAAVASNVQAPSLSEDTGVIGGVPGGVPGGVLGGILGGTGTAGPPVPVNSRGIVRVGGSVRPPQLVDRVQPEYPAVARAAHVQGTVVIDAVIDATGNVISEHAVSGPDLLIPAALTAVQQWKYQPTVLNGQPVQLAMEVTVSFNLG